MMKKALLIFTLIFSNSVLSSDFIPCKGAQKSSQLPDSLCTAVKASQYYGSNEDKKIDLFIRKFPALEQRKGSVWLIAGGPGESGASFYGNIDTFRKTFSAYDVLIPDHRGTGFSSPICPGQEVASAAGIAIVGQEWGQCFQHMATNAKQAKSFSVTNAAKDLRHLMTTLSGKGEIYLYGASYGTQLVLRTAQLDNRPKFNGIILDGLVSLQNDTQYGISEHSIKASWVGEQLMQRCDSKDKCLGETAQSLASRLRKITNKSNNLKDFSEKLPNASLTNLLGSMLDIPHIRNQIPRVIIGLSNNDATALENTINDMTLFATSFGGDFKNFGSSIPLVQIISQSENYAKSGLTAEQVKQREKSLLFTSPVPSHLTAGGWPLYAKDEFYAKSPVSLPKTLILQGTLDSKTYYDGAKQHAKMLSKAGTVSFVSVTDGVHFLSLHAPDCFKQMVGKFLIDELPSDSVCNDINTAINF